MICGTGDTGLTCEVCGDDGLVLYDGHQWCFRHLSPEARVWALEVLDTTFSGPA